APAPARPSRRHCTPVASGDGSAPAAVPPCRRAGCPPGLCRPLAWPPSSHGIWSTLASKALLMAAEMSGTMRFKQVVLSLWLGLLTLLWSCYPLLVSQARGIVVLAIFAGVLAGLGGLTGVRLLVVWSCVDGVGGLIPALR